MIKIKRSNDGVEIEHDRNKRLSQYFTDADDLFDFGLTIVKYSLLLAADQNNESDPFDKIDFEGVPKDILQAFIKKIKNDILSDENLLDKLKDSTSRDTFDGGMDDTIDMNDEDDEDDEDT